MDIYVFAFLKCMDRSVLAFIKCTDSSAWIRLNGTHGFYGTTLGFPLNMLKLDFLGRVIFVNNNYIASKSVQLPIWYRIG